MHIPWDAELWAQNAKLNLAIQGITGKTEHIYDALVALKQAEKLEPGNPVLKYELGWLFVQLGNYKEANSYFKKALEGDPFNADYLFALGQNYEKRQDAEKAIVFYKKSLYVKHQEQVLARLEKLEQ